MAITATTLVSDITANQLTIPVTSSTGATVGLPVKIDNEYMAAVVSIPTTTSIIVRGRGAEGTAAVVHDTLANVQLSSAIGDFPSTPAGHVNPVPPSANDVVTYGESGAIAVPVKDTVVVLDKATAGVMTLAAPSKAIDGVKLICTSQSAAAHTITGVALIADGVTGSPHSTATFAAFKGASITLCADQGLWNVISALGVTTA